MHYRKRPVSALLGSLSLLLLSSNRAQAIPLSEIGELEELSELQNSSLVRRCANPCGYYGQVCCAVGQQCYTDANNEAQCGAATAAPTAAPSGPGYWQYYTTTWVVTDTITKTSVYSSFVPSQPTQPAAVTTAVGASCDTGQGETPCGNICCASGQYCVVPGQCAPVGGSASAPLRPTSAGTGVVTITSFSTTTTVPFMTPVPTAMAQNITELQTDSSSGLSGGAIAGIVIGVLIAVFILLLLCLFFCFRAIWDAIASFFGLGKKDRRKETIEVESYHRSGRTNSRNWYSGLNRPGRPGAPKRGGINNGFAGLGSLGILGLGKKRDNRQRRREKESEVSDSFFSDDVTESDIQSSGRRTADTRRSTREAYRDTRSSRR